jgi:hypothetical protein
VPPLFVNFLNLFGDKIYTQTIGIVYSFITGRGKGLCGERTRLFSLRNFIAATRSILIPPSFSYRTAYTSPDSFLVRLREQLS